VSRTSAGRADVKVETWLFSAGTLFFLPVAVIYGVLTQWQEPAGTTALFLTAGLAGLIGLYLAVTARRISPRPEDDLDGEIADGAGEMGFFAPHSWWPLPVAFSAALIFFGAAVGWWVSIIGVGIGVIATVGWVYEHYRGEHAH